MCCIKDVNWISWLFFQKYENHIRVFLSRFLKTPTGSESGWGEKKQVKNVCYVPGEDSILRALSLQNVHRKK